MYGNTSTNKCEPCHSNCAICFGPTKNNCSLCNGILVLSGFTCDTTCLPNFGVSNQPFYCLACNATCSTCAHIATNCSACQTTGNFSSFLMVYNSTYSECLMNCTSKYFENYGTLTCDPCNISCTACDFNTNNCTACVTGLALLNNTCFSSCPNGYYLNGLICSKCNNKCLLCTTSPTNC
jgi:proprotein convertase subtilisin/kexin type 5